MKENHHPDDDAVLSEENIIMSNDTLIQRKIDDYNASPSVARSDSEVDSCQSDAGSIPRLVHMNTSGSLEDEEDTFVASSSPTSQQKPRNTILNWLKLPLRLIATVGILWFCVLSDGNGTTPRDCGASINEHRQERLARTLSALETLVPRVIEQRRARLVERLSQQLEQSWMSSFLNDSIADLASAYYHRTQKNNDRRQRPGYRLSRKFGVEGKHPVVMVPGFVTSGLEIWRGRECAESRFNPRQRLWGSMDGVGTMFTDRACWQQHLSLDPWTGKDPDGIRVRAAESFQAADYFAANYWVWDKLIQNLADIGYDASTMSMETYDWRLSFPMLEERDGYLTKLRHRIEAFHETTGEKVVLASHSMGAMLVHYFFRWVTTPVRKGGGGGGKKWVDKHVHAYANIAGSHLGVPKAASALLSGEMKDTVIMGTVGAMVEQFFGRSLRKNLWTTWGSLWGMLPQGGDRIWGTGADICGEISPEKDTNYTVCGRDNNNAAAAAASPSGKKPEHSDYLPLFEMTDDAKRAEKEIDYTTVLHHNNAVTNNNNLTAGNNTRDDRARLNATVQKFLSRGHHTTNEIIDFLVEWGGGLGPSTLSSRLYKEKKERTGLHRISWLDPLSTPLPHAPNLKIYCLYGVGVNTDRTFFYKRNSENPPSAGGENNYTTDNRRSSNHWRRSPTDLPVVLDTDYDDPERNVRHGIRFTDGDGSVPLLSLGYTCVDAWKRDSYLNPSGTSVVTREYRHRQEFSVDDPMRGGPASSDHVDILGNAEMTEDLLRIAADYDPVEESRIVSNIRRMSDEINNHPLYNSGDRRHQKQQRRRRFFSFLDEL